VLAGTAPVLVAFPRERPPRAPSRRAAAPPSPSPPASLPPPPSEPPPDPAVWARLRALRLRLAAAEGLPAFCVFHDTTLLAIARARPRDLAALAVVRGIGAHKLARYGPAVLEALAELPDQSVVD
jgi:superfamily II DNA helicase RecQ